MNKKNRDKENWAHKIYVKHKAMFISIILIALFFIFEYLGICLKDECKVLSDIFLALAAQCMGIGALAVIWELFMETSWLKIIRNHILNTITTPEVAEYLETDWQTKILRQLLLSIAGNHIGSTVYKGIENDSFNEEKMRKDFIYNISLAEKDEHFYNAQFYIKFTTSEIRKNFSIRFSKLNNSLEIHNYYQNLVKNNSDIYRYILLSEQEELPDDCFSVMECKIKSNNLEVELNPIYPKNLLNNSIELKPQKEDSKNFKKICKKKNCEIMIRINTIIDKRWNYFPIMFGYPVSKFSTRLDAGNTDISQIDMLEFFTSVGNFIRNEGINENIVAAAGKLEEIMLPDSGLVYVWK